MPDQRVLKHIEDLVREEQRLRDAAAGTDADRLRLEAIAVELGQYWDLLRQRRAFREFGEDPGEAHIRSADVVEKYEG